jgi:hypothetical protein
MSADSPVAVLHNTSGVEVGTGAAPVRVDPTGSTTQPVSVAALPLPSGAATSTIQTDGTQKTQVTSLPAIPTGSNTIGKVDQGTGGASAWKVDGSAVVQPILSGAIVDSNNSTTTPLISRGIFVGTATNVLGYSQVTVMISSDQPSIENGISMEFSPDGSNWNHKHISQLRGHDSTFFYGLGVHEKFFRVVYSNGLDAQGTFSVQVLLKPLTSVGTVRGLSEPPSLEDDALLTQSVLVGASAGVKALTQALVTKHGRLQADSEDEDIRETLKEILSELRRHSVWFESMTGLALGNGDVS